jgi:hypothetical protein
MGLHVQLLVLHERGHTNQHHFFLPVPHSRALAFLTYSRG